MGSAVAAAASAAATAPGSGRDHTQPPFSCWTNSDFREIITESIGGSGTSVASSYWPAQGQAVVVTNGHQHHQQPAPSVHTHRVAPSSQVPFKGTALSLEIVHLSLIHFLHTAGILRPPLGVHPHQSHQHKPYSRPVRNS